MTDTLRPQWFWADAIERDGKTVRRQRVCLAADVERVMGEKDELIASLQHTTSYESVMELKAALAAKDILPDELAVLVQQAIKSTDKPATYKSAIEQLLVDHFVWEKHSITQLVTDKMELKAQLAAKDASLAQLQERVKELEGHVQLHIDLDPSKRKA